MLSLFQLLVILMSLLSVGAADTYPDLPQISSWSEFVAYIFIMLMFLAAGFCFFIPDSSSARVPLIAFFVFLFAGALSLLYTYSASIY